MDPSLKRVGMQGEERRTEVIVVKNHYPAISDPVTRANPIYRGRVIDVIRHPLRAAPAESSRRAFGDGRGESHAQELPLGKLRSSFNSLKRRLIGDWARHADHFLHKFKGAILFVKYEDIKDNLTGVHTEQTLPFLGINTSRAQIRTGFMCSQYSGVNRNMTHRSHSYNFSFTEADFQDIRPHKGITRSTQLHSIRSSFASAS